MSRKQIHTKNSLIMRFEPALEESRRVQLCFFASLIILSHLPTLFFLAMRASNLFRFLSCFSRAASLSAVGDPTSPLPVPSTALFSACAGAVDRSARSEACCEDAVVEYDAGKNSPRNVRARRLPKALESEKNTPESETRKTRRGRDKKNETNSKEIYFK